MAADWLVKNKGMEWRRDRIKKTKRVKTEDGDRGMKRAP